MPGVPDSLVPAGVWALVVLLLVLALLLLESPVDPSVVAPSVPGSVLIDTVVSVPSGRGVVDVPLPVGRADPDWRRKNKQIKTTVMKYSLKNRYDAYIKEKVWR